MTELWDLKVSAQWGCEVFWDFTPAPLPAGGIFIPAFAAPALPGDGAAGEGFMEQLRSPGKLGRAGDNGWTLVTQSSGGLGGLGGGARIGTDRQSSAADR